MAKMPNIMLCIFYHSKKKKKLAGGKRIIKSIGEWTKHLNRYSENMKPKWPIKIGLLLLIRLENNK